MKMTTNTKKLFPPRPWLLEMLEAISRAPSEKLLDIMAMTRQACGGEFPAGPPPFTCGIVNAKSGLCGEDCAFCAQSRRHSADIQIYPLIKTGELLARAAAFAGDGLDYLGIVISGDAATEAEFQEICQAVCDIRAKVKIKLCASLGLLSPERAGALKAAGVTSYHHNLECSPAFYPRICGTHSLDRRVESVVNAREAGLRVCSGGLFGLGESWAERLELAELLAELKVDSIPINFLNPIPGTPLEKSALLAPREALGIISLFRLMHPGRDIVICGGRGRVLGEWDRLIFSAGANGLMVGDYLTTKGEAPARDFAVLRELGLR